MADRYTLKLTILIFLLLGVACTGSPPDIDCNIQKGSCEKMVNGVKVVFDITPKPVKSMKRLNFELSLNQMKDPAPEEVFLSLSMPGMKMGENVVVLHKVNKGLYKGEGVIVRCPSGKTVWQADIEIRGLGRAFFVFDVRP